MKVSGGCHCGAIAYEAEIDPAKVGICHCTDCQMLTGTAYRVSVPAPAAQFRITRGTPTVYIKRTAVYTLRIGNIAERANLPPQRQMWTKSRLPWLSQDLNALPGPEKE